jgi:hypothetical protein
MQPVLDSLPPEWEVLIWDNGDGKLTRWFKNDGMDHGEQYEPYWQHDMSVQQQGVADLSVYGRYAAIEYASHEVVYVQDDDVIVSDPKTIATEWDRVALTQESDPAGPGQVPWADHIVANMPQEFRHDGYTDSCLVGFGACFHRDLPKRAFDRFLVVEGADLWEDALTDKTFLRTCDVVFTTLTPRVLVDVPRTNREFATDANRMYRQPGHVSERTRMLELARRVRDA